ncbi:MAG: hypothetical protein ACLTDF_04130 [Coprococcus sp.]
MKTDSIIPRSLTADDDTGVGTGYDRVEIDIANNDSLTLEIWGSANTYSVAPKLQGRVCRTVSPRYDKSTVIKPIFGGGTVYVDYFHRGCGGAGTHNAPLYQTCKWYGE